MNRDTSPHTAAAAATACRFCGADISDMPGSQHCSLGCEEADRATSYDADEGYEVTR